MNMMNTCNAHYCKYQFIIRNEWQRQRQRQQQQQNKNESIEIATTPYAIRNVFRVYHSNSHFASCCLSLWREVYMYALCNVHVCMQSLVDFDRLLAHLFAHSFYLVGLAV